LPSINKFNKKKEDFYMLTYSRIIRLFLFLAFGILSIGGYSQDSVILYTPYTKISVNPGEAIDYPIDVINNTKQLQDVEISIVGMPRGWNYTIKSSTWNVGQIAVLPAERKTFQLRVEVPLKVKKGTYRFKVLAGTVSELPLVVIVSEEGTFKTEFTSEQLNMQGNSSSTFTFNANLKNRTSEKQLYAFMSYAPRGWNVTFKVNYQAVTSCNIEANATQAVVIEIKPPENVEAGTYKIPVNATTSSTSANLDLELVVTGSFKMELTTPTGLVSTNLTAGHEKRLELVVNNSGSAALTDIVFDKVAPANWDVIFDPKKLDKLLPGKTAQVFATIKADKKAIAGDYVTNLEARTPETSVKVTFRISVETPMLYGWVGIFIILVALGSVWYLFRKYGRR
jgi:uncharacterized membrane protein